MSHKGLKSKIIGRNPNDLCPCKSGKKYKTCCGNGMKYIGVEPRGSAKKKDKINQGEVLEATADILRLRMFQDMMQERRTKPRRFNEEF